MYVMYAPCWKVVLINKPSHHTFVMDTHSTGQTFGLQIPTTRQKMDKPTDKLFVHTVYRNTHINIELNTGVHTETLASRRSIANKHIT